jgi:hypothetical protein
MRARQAVALNLDYQSYMGQLAAQLNSSSPNVTTGNALCAPRSAARFALRLRCTARVALCQHAADAPRRHRPARAATRS